MKLKTLYLGIAALAAVLTTTPAARSQDAGDAMLNRMASWFTGSASILNGPSCDNASCSDPAGARPLNCAEDTCCADGTCGCCSQCCHRYDTWGSVEFLMWWGKGTPLPPLVTTSTAGTARVDAGVIGIPSTSVLFGNQLAGNKMQGGGRVTAGIWLDPDHNVAAGGRFFGLGGDTTRFAQSSTGDPILGRPFFNTTLNRQDALSIRLSRTTGRRRLGSPDDEQHHRRRGVYRNHDGSRQPPPRRSGGGLSILPPGRRAANRQQ